MTIIQKVAKNNVQEFTPCFPLAGARNVVSRVHSQTEQEE